MITTYFKDYPAYENAVFLTAFSEGRIGFSFSETSLNKQYFGSYNRCAVLPDFRWLTKEK